MVLTKIVLFKPFSVAAACCQLKIALLDTLHFCFPWKPAEENPEEEKQYISTGIVRFYCEIYSFNLFHCV
jgi:hypothetical protein